MLVPNSRYERRIQKLNLIFDFDLYFHFDAHPFFGSKMITHLHAGSGLTSKPRFGNITIIVDFS